jgi:prophage tail gpP-like protein
MPNPAEIAKVVANGQTYQIWQSLEVHASFDETIDHAMLQVSELTSPSAVAAMQRLKPGDDADIYLAGNLVMKGTVYLRQGSMDADSQAVARGTVPAKPGQHLNQTAQSIISYLYGTVGVNFKIVGAPPGADKIFPRFSEHVGETLFDCAERLCKMSNLHQMDDGQGGIQAFRGAQSSSGLILREGYNIKRQRLLLRVDEMVGPLVTVIGQNPTRDSTQNSNPKATATTDNPIQAPTKIVAEEQGDSERMQLRADHQTDLGEYTTVDGEITVQGWFASDGSLWWQHARNQELITLTSSLVPGGSDVYMIKGIVHRQNDIDGTTTSILLCSKNGFGKTDPLVLNSPESIALGNGTAAP